MPSEKGCLQAGPQPSGAYVFDLTRGPIWPNSETYSQQRTIAGEWFTLHTHRDETASKKIVPSSFFEQFK